MNTSKDADTPLSGLRAELGVRHILALVLLGLFLALLLLQTGLEFLVAGLNGDENPWLTAGASLGGWLLPFLAIALSTLLAIAIHEGGHALAGRLVGLWFFQAQIGPLVITRARRGVQLSLSTRRWTGGHVLSCPLDERSLRRRYGVYSAGGPLASLGLTLLAWWLARDYLALCATGGNIFACTVGSGGYGLVQTPLLDLLLADTVFISAVAFIGTILPYRTRQNTSDGLKILTALKHGQETEWTLLFWQITSYLLRGVRSRDWPAMPVLQAVTLAKTPAQHYIASLCAYYRALDVGDIASAGVYLDATIAARTPPAKTDPTFALEVAYFEARYRYNSATARLWQSQGKGSRYAGLMQARAGAAIALAEGRTQEALTLAAQGLVALEQARKSSQETHVNLDLEEDGLREMIAEAQRLRAAQPVTIE